MKFTQLIFTLCLFYSLNSMGQKDNGFYGNKAFVQVQTLMNYPMFSNLLLEGQGYKQSGAKLVNKKDNFNIGFRVTAGYSIQRNFSLLFEYGQDFSSVYLNDYSSFYQNSVNYNSIKHEMIDVTTTVFMPILEFGSSNALLPMGLSHQIGFGFANSKAIEKDYMFQVYGYDDMGWETNSGYVKYSTSNIKPLDFDRLESVKKYVIMYGLSMRSPITKSLMINYGIKYTLNLGRNQYYYSYNNENLNNDLNTVIYKHRSFSFINLNIGLCFAF